MMYAKLMRRRAALTRTENDVKYRELKDPVEINNFMKKWKEQNE